MNWKRIIATLIDLVTISIIISPFFAICIWDGHVNLIVFVFSLLITLLLCKDNMNGQSIGKRVMKIRIVNNGSERTPKNSSLILRNIIGLLLFPIEIILTLLNHKKRELVIICSAQRLSRVTTTPISLSNQIIWLIFSYA